MNISKKDYIVKKLTIEGECECEIKDIEKGYCGYCWYNSVTCWDPPECNACKYDTVKCDNLITKALKGSTIKLETTCCIWCCWWEWFHSKRMSMAKKKNITIKYKH